jgi:proline dehydrogenase
MEQERARAAKLGYPSPIYPDKKSTDHAFDSAIEMCLRNIDRTWLFAGTHNETSLMFLMDKMQEYGLKNDDPRIFVSQLYGMSDHISFNMAHKRYNVAKYIPYGPVRYLLPYLIRRAEENKSVTGDAGRERHFINLELKRRSLV